MTRVIILRDAIKFLKNKNVNNHEMKWLVYSHHNSTKRLSTRFVCKVKQTHDKIIVISDRPQYLSTKMHESLRFHNINDKIDEVIFLNEYSLLGEEIQLNDVLSLRSFDSIIELS